MMYRNLLLLLCCAQALCATDAPRHVILFIADGSQLAHEICVSRYLHGRDEGLSMHDFPYRGFATTWDIDTYDSWAGTLDQPRYQADQVQGLLGYNVEIAGVAPYPLQPLQETAERYLMQVSTDSAAAGTALATGHKTARGNISWQAGDPPDGQLQTICDLARAQQGMAIGVISSVPFSHATPAAFVSHNPDRGDFHGIAAEIIHEVRPEVVIGAGHPDPGNDGQSAYKYIHQRDLTALRESEHWLLADAGAQGDAAENLQTAADMAVSSGRKLFGLYGKDPDPAKPGAMLDGDPPLGACVRAALTVLTTDPDGSFLMVEGGDVDWANHRDDTAWMLRAWSDLEQAIAQTIADIEGGRYEHLRPDNTLVIVTSDHGNGMMRLRPGYALPIGQLPQAAQAPAGSYIDTWPDDAAIVYPNYADGRRYYGHSNELVTCYAWGAGIEHLRAHEGALHPGTGLLDNTHIFHAMADHLQIQAEVPVLTAGE
ncbi:MAG: alkaline phosphatase [Planctomycetota bacterium]